MCHNLNDRKIDYIDILSVFKPDRSISEISFDLLSKNLPDDSLIQKSVVDLQKSNQFENVNMLNDLDKIIKKELSYQDISIRETKLADLLKNIYHFYFPEIQDEGNDNYIFDYFGVINFIVNINNIFQIAFPSISKENLKRLNNFPKDEDFANFFRNEYSKNYNIDEIQKINGSIAGIDYNNTSHEILFSLKNASLYFERKFDFSEINNNDTQTNNENKIDFIKCISKQDIVLSNINSKHIIKIKAEEIVNSQISSISKIPFFPTSLCEIIRTNDKNYDKKISDCDKILWAIQIASAYDDLLNFIDESDNMSDYKHYFQKTIFDQSFFIDSMKNIYLGSLSYDINKEGNASTSDGPMYFRSISNPTYFYTYGVLLFEIFCEIEPKNIFGNAAREPRNKAINDGYINYPKFLDYVKECCQRYDDEKLKEIIERCVGTKNSFNNFKEIIEQLKELKLYKKYKNIIEMRERNVKQVASTNIFSFHDLLTAAVLDLLQVKEVLEHILENLKSNLVNSTNVEGKIVKAIQILNEEAPVQSYFDALKEILYDHFAGFMDDLLAPIIGYMAEKKDGKILVLKESEIQGLGFSVDLNSFVKDLPTPTKVKTFNPRSYHKSSPKIPIISLDYYLSNCKSPILYQYEWIYQIIYFTAANNFYFSTNEESYKIDLSDFALFFNNKTKQFDVDFKKTAISKIENCNNAINISSLGSLFEGLIKNNNLQCTNFAFESIYIDESDNFPHQLMNEISIGSLMNSFIQKSEIKIDTSKDNVETIGEFIACCIQTSQKINNELVEDFMDDFLLEVNNNPAYLFKLLQLYLDQLKRITKEDIENALNHVFTSNVSNKAFRVFLDTLSQSHFKYKLLRLIQKKNPQIHNFEETKANDFKDAIMKELSNFDEQKFNEIKEKIIKKIGNYHLLKDSNYRVLYSKIKTLMDIWLNICPLPEEIDFDEPSDNYYFYYINEYDDQNANKNTNDEILKEIFPQKEKTELSRYSNEQDIKIAIKNIIKTVGDDDGNIFYGKNDDYKISLILKAFPVKDKYFIINKYEKNHGQVYKTLKALCEIGDIDENDDFFENYADGCDLINLKKNFPDLDEKTIKYHYKKNKGDYFNTVKSLLNFKAPLKKREYRPLENYAEPLLKKHSTPNTKVEVPRFLEISELKPISIAFMVRRYIFQLNPKFNYKLSLKIQNNKINPENNISLNELEDILKKIHFEAEAEGGNLILRIPSLM